MENLYLFAIIPPPDLIERLQRERIQFSENYNCIKALKPPIHITIYEPFKEDEDFEVRVAGLEKWVNAQAPFTIALDNYAFFEHKQSPVFFIKVIKDDNISMLRTGLLRELKKYIEDADTELLPNGKPIPKPKPQPFNPHITLGYRDLAPDLVPVIKRDYAMRHFKADFLCSAIYLWRHDGQGWRVEQEFVLNGSVSVAPTLF